MKVRLSAIGDNPGDGGLRQQWVFGETGGSIGRSPSCDWTLADPNNTLSGRHALIGFANGTFTITDISTNGVYINTVSSPLGRSRTAPLREGDILYLGPYALKVELVPESGPQRGAPRVQPDFSAAVPAAGGGTPIFPPPPRASLGSEPLVPPPMTTRNPPPARQPGLVDPTPSNAPLADLFQAPAPRASSLLSDPALPTARQMPSAGGWDQSGLGRRDDPLAALPASRPPGESGLHGLAAVEAALFGSLPPMAGASPSPFPNSAPPSGAPARPSPIPAGAPALKPPSGAPTANVVRAGGVDIPLDFLDGLTATFDAKPQPVASTPMARSFAPPPPIPQPLIPQPTSFAPPPAFAPAPPMPPQSGLIPSQPAFAAPPSFASQVPPAPQPYPPPPYPPQPLPAGPEMRTSAAPIDPREAAVRAALRASVGQLLSRIAPDEISRSLSHTAPLLTGPDPAALWERYCTLYRDLLAGLDATLPQIIGSAFSDAAEIRPADPSRYR